MNIRRSRERVMSDYPRAGFWRRLSAALVDILVVVVPFQIAVVILFQITGGVIQMDGGVNMHHCQSLRTIPSTLEPPPPEIPNYAVHCWTSFAGYMSANTLEVGRQTREGIATKRVFRDYRLDKKGDVIAGYPIDALVEAIIVLYLIACIAQIGRTLGMRVSRIFVVDLASQNNPSWRQAFLRYLYMATGLLPAAALLGYIWVTGSNLAFDSMTLLGGITLVLLFAAGWMIVNVVLIATKRDSLYDRWAGTAILLEV